MCIVCHLFDLPMAGGLVLLPKKLVRKRDCIRVDLPRPDSPRERERERGGGGGGGGGGEGKTAFQQ